MCVYVCVCGDEMFFLSEEWLAEVNLKCMCKVSEVIIFLIELKIPTDLGDFD